MIDLIQSFFIGGSTIGAISYLISRLRIYCRCDDPVVIIDSNENEIVSFSDEQKEVIIINRHNKKCQNACI